MNINMLNFHDRDFVEVCLYGFGTYVDVFFFLKPYLI